VNSGSFAPFRVPGELADALADSLEAQLQPVNDPSAPAVTVFVNVAVHAGECAPQVNRK
jgi:hypothetical protein